MSAPYEVIAAPLTLYVAPVGTLFPDLDAEPSGSWAKVGSSGDRNYSEDGVSVQHQQNVELFRALGSTGPIKAFRTEEGLGISVTLHDVTLEQYRLALNGNAVTEVTNNNPHYKKVGLSRGRQVTQYALLARGMASGYGDDLVAQYEVPVVIETGEPEPVYQKGEPAGLELQFTALEDPDAASEDERFGRLVMQTDDAT